jgi:two-component system, cell cycle response regulator
MATETQPMRPRSGPGDAEDAGRPATKVILIVDDDAQQSEALQTALSQEGYQVSTAPGGKEALARAKETTPDLILLDVQMPELDGFAVIRELASDHRTVSVPVLLMSASQDLATRVRSCNPGGELDFLHKPYRLDELLARVDRCLRGGELLDRLRRNARIDDLTGLGNMRLFHEQVATETSRLERYASQLSIVMADVDGLKAINDREGHAVGSAVLAAIGGALRTVIRGNDLATRYGGDEFVVLLSHTSLSAGVAFCERLLDEIRRLRPHGLRVSVSVGVAAFTPGIDRSLHSVLERADGAAYRAKQLGGDRVSADDPHGLAH